MSNNGVLLICSVLLLAMAFVFVWLSWSRLDIVDVHIFMIGIFFGGYTFIDALVNDASGMNSFVIVLVFCLVVVGAVTTWYAVRLLPRRFRITLELRYLTARWMNVPTLAIILLVVAVAGFQLYGYQNFGIARLPSDTEFDLLQQTLPYWFTSLLPFMQALTFCLSLPVALKAFVSGTKGRVFWLVILGIILLSAGLYGRRSVLYILLMVFILWTIVKGRSPLSVRNILMVPIVLAILLVFSNLYQNYRDDLVNTGAFTTASQSPDFFESLTDVESTLSNLQERRAMWRFNYIILERQEGSATVDVPYGNIMLQGFKNSVPSILWPTKSVRDLDEMTASLYGLPTVDYPTNDFASIQADFGYWSIAVLPLLRFFVFTSVAVLMRATWRHPVLLLLVSGFFLNYLVNIENNYARLFLLYRDIFLVIILYGGIYAASLMLPGVGLKRRRRLVSSARSS